MARECGSGEKRKEAPDGTGSRSGLGSSVRDLGRPSKSTEIGCGVSTAPSPLNWSSERSRPSPQLGTDHWSVTRILTYHSDLRLWSVTVLALVGSTLFDVTVVDQRIE